MKKLTAALIGTIIAITSVFFLANPANAAEPNRSITVNGVGTASITPDAVRLLASVSVVASTSKSALSQASSAASSVREALKKSGIATKDFKTSSLSVYPEYNYTQDKGSILTGYRATQSFNVVIRKADSAGSVIDAVVEAGGDAVQINSAAPFLLNGAVATEQARAAAVADAKARATSYTKLLGVKLGQVISISEVSAPNYVFPGVAMDKASGAGSTQIDLGEQEVTVTITVNWALG